MAPRRSKRGGNDSTVGKKGGNGKKSEKIVNKRGRGATKKDNTKETNRRNKSRSLSQSNATKGKRSLSRKRGKENQKKRTNEKKKPLTAEELDSAMDDYWMKSDNKELASKKLDDDMDAYWNQKGQTEEDTADEPSSEAQPDGPKESTEVEMTA